MLPAGAVLAPECIADEPGLRVLHRRVTSYGTPHAVAIFRCVSAHCHASLFRTHAGSSFPVPSLGQSMTALFSAIALCRCAKQEVQDSEADGCSGLSWL
jgi:hypothetical protein